MKGQGMHEFKAGQEVRVKIEELRDYKVKVPEGTVGTFDHYDLGNRWGLVRFPGYVGDGPDGLVKTWDKELEAVQPGSDVALKPGDKVRYVDDYHPAHSHNVKKGDVREVAEVTHVGHITLTPVPGDTMHPRYTFGQGSFELVPEGPKWSDVEPGDKVTIRVRDTGEELTTTATHRSDAYGQAYNRASVLGLAPGLGLPSNRWELVSIEKPKPQPPTTPGSVVLVHSSSRAWPNGLPLLRQHTGRWIGQNGQSWSDHDVAYANGGTFTVIHDAGAQS